MGIDSYDLRRGRATYVSRLTPDMDDMRLVDTLSHGRVDLTFGSALDIFGGTGVTLAELVQWNQTAPRS